MKLDKNDKFWSRVIALAFWSMFLNLWGGMYPAWVPDATMENQFFLCGSLLFCTLLFTALAYLTEES